MKRTSALVVALATVLMTTAANAERPPHEEVQSPRGQDVQVPRDRQDETQAPRGEEIQAPRR